MASAIKKFTNIIEGWKNYVFENEQVEAIARERAKECSNCDHAKKGLISSFIEDKIQDIEGLVCELCDCPLSGLCRSMDSKCKANKWQSKAQTK